jgi:hypothetical protein
MNREMHLIYAEVTAAGAFLIGFMPTEQGCCFPSRKSDTKNIAMRERSALSSPLKSVRC